MWPPPPDDPPNEPPDVRELLDDVAREDRPAFVSLFLYLVRIKEGDDDADHPSVEERREIERRERLARVLGVRVADTEVERILNALGLGVETVTDGWRVTAPTRRFDIEIEEDLIEEVVRFIGYDKLPTTAPIAPITARGRHEDQRSSHAVRAALAGLGA